jgi:hypothetical protein
VQEHQPRLQRRASAIAFLERRPRRVGEVGRREDTLRRIAERVFARSTGVPALRSTRSAVLPISSR